MEETHWYYIDPRDKSQVGPLTLDEMKERYQDGRLSEETYAWHEDAEQWAKLRELRFNSRTLREIIAFSTAPGSRKITEQLETSERSDRAKSVVDELQRRMERLQEASEVDIEERIRVNRERTGTATTRLPARSVVVPQSQQAPESSPETSSDSSSESSEDETALDWVERVSPEGAPYFTNVRSGQRTDSRPEILEELVWLPDQKEGYTAARLISGAKPAAQRIDSEEVVSISSEAALQKFYRGALSLELADLVQLKPVHESRILLILRNRLAQGKIYTRIGNVLVNLNPYTPLPLYPQTLITKLQTAGGFRQPEPHIYEVAFSALASMREDAKSQSIIITGESGSGKTEAAKHCMRLLAEVAGSELAAEEKLLLATPILEAFGNAKTIRNENSSRVGKWTEVHFSDRGTITGALIRNFLLEKTRVVHQAKGERNFRIFYQLLSHKEEFPALNVAEVAQWRYLNDVALRTDCEFASFEEVRSAMKGLGIEGVEAIMAVAAAILHLGNVEFQPAEEGCRALEDIHFSSACTLLGLSSESLRQFLCNKKLFLAKETILKPHSVAQAREAVANFSKTLYTSLFQYLLAAINQQVRSDVESEVKLGVLDIYGFEIFPENSFEQLCINYANEKLQQYFVQCLFKEEEDLYESEGISISAIPYADNLPILNLIESGGNSLLYLINDEITLQRASDETLLKRIYSMFQSNSSFRSEFRSNSQFLVQHYSGEVVYDVSGFIGKSKDQVSEDLIALVEGAHGTFVREICAGQLKQSKKSIGIQFKEELDELLESLADYTPHFVRCIKPNSNCAPLAFEGSLVLHQIRCLGLVEATEIAQTGFPFKVPHREFVHRYKCIATSLRAPNPKAMCKRLTEACGEMESGFRIGKTMVLFGFKQHRALEKQRSESIVKIVIMIQKHYRRHRAQKMLAEAKAASKEIALALTSTDVQFVREILLKFGHLRFETRKYRLLKELANNLTEEQRIDDDFQRLLSIPKPETAVEEMENVLSKAEKLRYRSPLIGECRSRLKLARDIKSAQQSLKRLSETHMSLWEMRTTIAAIAEQDLQQYMGEWLTCAQKLVEKSEREAGLKQSITELMTTGAISQIPPGEEHREALGRLRSAIDQAKSETPFYNSDTGEIVKLGEILYEFRSAILREDWTQVESMLRTVSSYKELKEVADMTVVRSKLASRESKVEVERRLVAAIHCKDIETTRLLLQTVDQNESQISPQDLGTAQKLLQESEAMEEKIAKVPFDTVEIDSLLCECREKCVPASAIAALSRKKEEFLSFLRESALALNLVSLPRMRTALAKARGMGLNSHPLITEMNMLLYECKESTLARLQYDAAVRLGDKAMVLERLIAMRDLQWRNNSTVYEWTRYPRLRSPEEWAASKWIGRDVLAKGMLKHSKHLLPASLTALRSTKQEKLALDLFKGVLTVMGDRVAHNDIVGEALDILITGIQKRELREEIYMQILKQLTKNDSENSVRRGWELLSICLRCFSHSSLDCYLHSFIRTECSDAEALLRLMYYSQIQPLAVAPTREWVASYLKLRWHVSFPETIYTPDSHPDLTILRLTDQTSS